MSALLPIQSYHWLKILNLRCLERLGHIHHALFDFDGTLSVLRAGWEGVMVPLMIQMICGEHPPTPEIEREVQDYVDRSTGILTIEQMQWLADAVRRHGRVREPRTAAEYKAAYVEQVLARVQDPLVRLARAEVPPDDLTICGARAFVAELYRRGITLYLASGTDHEHVLNEADALGLTGYFTGGVYGALDESKAHTKELIIHRILEEHDLAGRELLVVGDGPVEMRAAVAHAAIALGVASDEVAGSGWNPHKIRRLTEAGADLLVPDFTHHRALLALLLRGVKRDA